MVEGGDGQDLLISTWKQRKRKRQERERAKEGEPALDYKSAKILNNLLNTA